MTDGKPYSQSRRILRRYQVDVVQYAHRFPAHPDPRVCYQGSVDCQRGTEEEADSTFAHPKATEEEARLDALRIVARRLLGRDGLVRLARLTTDARLAAMALPEIAADYHGQDFKPFQSGPRRDVIRLVDAVRQLLLGES